MKKAAVIIPALALLLLGSHGLRQGDYGQAASLAIMAGLVLRHRPWACLATVAALLWAGWIWADAMVDIIRFRQAFDLPWTRLVLIMGTIVIFNGVALWVLVSRVGWEFFHGRAGQAVPRAVVLILVCVGLAVARAKVPFPILLADRYLPGWGWLEIFILALYAQWIFGLMVDPGGHRKHRPRIWGLFSAVFFLQLILGLLGMDRMLMTGSLHLPVPALIVAGPVFRGGGLFMIILFSVTILLVGPAWCSHLCYVGAWDDAMSRLGRRPVSDPVLRRISLAGRGATLILCVSAALWLRAMGVSNITAVILAGAFGVLGVGVMVFVSRRRGMMVHCTAYCPMGLVANVLGRISPWRIRINSDCTRCGACYSRCRYNALDDLRAGKGTPGISCTLCGDCVSACVHGHIGYRFPGLSPKRARTVFLILAVSLHALFLGLARI